MTEDSPGTLVIRLSMNPKLLRAAFASVFLHLVWSGALMVFAVLLVRSQPGSLAMLAIAALLFGLSGRDLWRIVPHARRKYRVLSMGVPTLHLDDLGVRVRDVPMHLDGASLAWADCAAVVISKAPRGRDWPVQPARYVQFVPVSEDRVETTAKKRRDVRADVLGLSETAAALTWLELPGVRPDADDVVAWLSAHRPETRLVGAGHSVTDE